MKNVIIVMTLLLAVALLPAQNLIPNPSFEIITGSIPATFNSGQVDSWWGIGGGTFAKFEDRCAKEGPVVQAQNGGIFTSIEATNKAIATRLTTPVVPFQKLDLSFFWMVPPCQELPGAIYDIEFYLSNIIPVNSIFGFTANSTTPGYVLLGKSTIGFVNDYTWRLNAFSGFQQFTVPGVTANPGNYKFLYIVMRPHSQPPKVSGRPELDITPMVYLDNFSLTSSCVSDANADFNFSVDNGGVCTNVQFTPQTSGGTGPLNIFWDFGDGTCQFNGSSTTISHTYPAMGYYPVRMRVVDGNGCIKDVTKSILIRCGRCRGIDASFTIDECLGCVPYDTIHPILGPVVAGYTCQLAITDNSVPSPGGSISSWAWNGMSTTTPAHPFVVTVASSPGSTESICLVIRDNAGCMDMECQTVPIPCDAQKPEHRSSHEPIEIWPNPADGLLNIVFSPGADHTPTGIDVYDMQGKLVQLLTVAPGEYDKQFDTGALQNGIYIFSFRTDKGLENRKVVVQH